MRQKKKCAKTRGWKSPARIPFDPKRLILGGFKPIHVMGHAMGQPAD